MYLRGKRKSIGFVSANSVDEETFEFVSFVKTILPFAIQAVVAAALGLEAAMRDFTEK